MLPHIKYILTDLDNTFLNYDKSICSENMEALSSAKKNGLNVIISSGRSNMSLDVFTKRLGLDYKGNYVIAYNGCRIYEADTKKVIYEAFLDNEAAFLVSSIVSKLIPNTLCYKEDILYSESVNERTLRYAANSSIPLNKTDSLAELTKIGKIQKIIMIDSHEKLYKAYIKVISSSPKPVNAEMFFSSDELFEFSSKGKNKGTALLKLSEFLGEPAENFASVGDNQNDIEMLKYAGTGIAVANAVPECKKAADFITSNDCDHGGFAEAVYYVLNRQTGGSRRNN